MTILKQESATCRIIQYRHWLYGWQIARQRKASFFGVSYWKITAQLYSHQCESVDGYVRHFDWEEGQVEIGSIKQFK